MKYRPMIGALLLLAAGLVTASCDRNAVITSGNLRIEFDSGLNSRVGSTDPETGTLQAGFGPSEYLETLDFRTGPFRLTSTESLLVSDNTGTGTETQLTGMWTEGTRSVEKRVAIRTYEAFPDVAVFKVRFVNTGEDELLVRSWTVNRYTIQPGSESPGFWSFQGSSSDARADWVLPVTPGFYQENFMGMNQSDYGGGIPVTDLWRRDGGIAVGHLEPFPREVSLPVICDALDGSTEIGITKNYDEPLRLAPGDTLETVESFVSVHRGDYFSTLREYSRLLQDRGMEFAPSEDAAFETIWCGWGYERKFTVEDILQTLPKVKELGIKWAVIDDGFQVAEGDWRVDTKRFPGGSADMKRMVDAIHRYGLKAKLWWAPLAADPGSKVLIDHPDALLINKAGSPQYITWW
ncbi:MAG: alpha-galactosidase, partial [Bacteroidales bacterium]